MYFICSVLAGIMIILAYRQGLIDARKLKENEPITQFDFLENKQVEEDFEDDFLKVLKSIDDYNGNLNEI